MRKAPCITRQDDCKRPTHSPGGAGTAIIPPLPGEIKRRNCEMETMKIDNREYPVLGTIAVNGQPVPLLNIRMMSDERERELMRKGAAV